MRVIRSSLVGAVVAVVVGGAACGKSSGSAASPPAPRWHVAGGFLRDPQGRAVIMHGVNFAGAHKNPPYWGFHQAPDVARLRSEWGMNAVRFLVTWAAIEPSAGQFDAAYLDAVAERVQWAKDAGLLVVLDMHQDVYGEGFASGGGDGAPKWTCDASHYANFKPADVWVFNDLNADVVACYDHLWHSADLARDYAEAWKRLISRLSAFDNVIGFDPMNEPYWGSQSIGTFEPEILQPFYEALVPAVRGVAPDLVAFLEPSSFRNLGGSTKLADLPFGDVVYAPHSYDKDAEQGNGFDPAHRDAVIANIAALSDEAKGLGAALWIGEYGGQAQLPGITEYMNAQYDGAGAVAASSMYWAYDRSDGYGLLNPDGTDKPVLLDAVVRPYPERVAGDPVSYAFDAATKTFTFTYRPDRALTAPTIVSLPPRAYPSGARVECGGCAFGVAPGALTITAPAAGDAVTVTVRAP